MIRTNISPLRIDLRRVLSKLPFTLVEQKEVKVWIKATDQIETWLQAKFVRQFMDRETGKYAIQDMCIFPEHRLPENYTADIDSIMQLNKYKFRTEHNAIMVLPESTGRR